MNREIKFRAWDKKAKETFTNATEVYRHKPRGLLTNLYHKLNARNVKNGYGEITFSLDEFHSWANKNDEFYILFGAWVESGYQKRFKPTVDRIDSYEGYEFKNMQWLFWRDNFHKGIQEVSAKKLKPVLAYKGKEYIGRFKSISDAQYFLGLKSNGNISDVLAGRRKHVKGYSFIHENHELLEAEQWP